jgi:hypothetical protein
MISVSRLQPVLPGCCSEALQLNAAISASELFRATSTSRLKPAKKFMNGPFHHPEGVGKQLQTEPAKAIDEGATTKQRIFDPQ